MQQSPVDGMVQNTAACKTAFDLQRDVPTCTSASARDGSCLTAEQKTGIGELFSGARTASGKKIYASWPYDNGIQTGGWSFWKFVVPGILDSVAVGQIWMTPPQDAASFNPVQFAATGNLDQILTGVNATSSTYTESAMSFMTPPNPSNLSTLKGRGAKMMVYHGTADPIFSSDDTANWYDSLSKANSGDASNFARYYQVPGMNHCAGGPSTDQFDMLSPLVEWVEKGKAPAEIVATARGTGNAGGVNTDLPSDWAADRSRPLCVYPKVARYKGSGSMEVASNFSCQ
nr:tannase/feruloyl esterase family alpha/beta hydrolase [Comamonas testosteroni]